MEIYQTESQQVTAIKEFFQKNSKLILAATLVVIAVIVGMRFWQGQKFNTAVKASDLFQEMLVADLTQDEQTMQDKGQFIIEKYGKSPYAQFATLLLAKQAVKNDDLDKAQDHYRWVIQQDKAQKVAGPVAKSRLARILLVKGDYTNALELVKDPKDPYAVLLNEVAGDIYLAQGNAEEAKKAYLTALYHLPPGAQAPLLQLKLIDLGVREDEMLAPQGEENA